MAKNLISSTGVSLALPFIFNEAIVPVSTILNHNLDFIAGFNVINNACDETLDTFDNRSCLGTDFDLIALEKKTQF